MTSPGRILLIGYGHPDRGDDAAGPAVARRVKGRLPRPWEILEVTGDGTALMEAWRGADRVVVIDAVVSGAPPGTLHRLDARRLVAADEFRFASSHSLGLKEAISLARALDRLPHELEILGIEGKSFEVGTSVSPEVRLGIERAVALLQERFSIRREARRSGPGEIDAGDGGQREVSPVSSLLRDALAGTPPPEGRFRTEPARGRISSVPPARASTAFHSGEPEE